MFKHILVPTDGSRFSQETVKRAISFAKEAGARITFFSAEHKFSPLYFGGVSAISDASAAQIFHNAVDSVAHAILDEAVKLAQEAGVECDMLVLTSNVPYEAIIEAANRCACDLIFMASHGHKGITSLLLGGETQKVLTHCTIPVLVYRYTQA